ncbi:hypothetical protein FIV07_02015 [Mycobacterium sp. THAF192]|nr:hypothetical protein FIV07_02015 [Mycobacterium sp. THAF192]
MMPHHTTPPPPSVLSQQALLLDTISNLIDLARADGNRVLRELPRTAPLFGIVDLVTALGHLRQAAVLIDKAADTFDATGAN